MDEPAYSFGSADNLRKYDTEIRLDDADLNSVHGVRADGKWSAVFGASGGPSGIYQHSAIEVDRHLYLAVGDQVVCLDLVTGSKNWSRRVDQATCFGVYWDCAHKALISHGEVQISRLSLSGDEIWSATGADIFSEGFRCLANGVEAVDFNQSVYLFDYASGAILAGP
ncbi:hypothetical protein N2603_15725 [Bradyrhizobium huanghuaihaiense]|uniref:hypothetical protein n=1 Tax=Bradyrhizobium huanghuaihaiense TaxID=990078 RepID=UPI0021A999AE|nr:hypothetical protein [Bradyrhizobium sp. CB3035]UWU79856.1 hypothetical protein N2603_15725 [Bradyrhizobium sp. CB3035]